MFYKMITKKRDSWYASPSCTVHNILDYIVRTGQMRDAQIDAIKTYLFLKIACENKPLYALFIQGAFNNLYLDDLEISNTLREYLNHHPAAAALYEYATIKNEDGEQVSKMVEQKIKSAPEEINYKKVFENAFDNVTYTDYLFSLPMGAGKTYLMATFIYLDLYFAQNEPDNESFAHNFIIFAPSGLKSSVVPSLRTIQNFIPSWILPEPAASDLKRQIKFEILDQNKAQNKSNKTKNPNAQKINMHLSEPDLFGLVAVTNAEKVILDRIKEKDGQMCLFEESDDEKDRQANELRNLIGKIPSLSVFIDEVHHAATEDKKLRAVVNNWMRLNHLNSIIGFSGTPYLEKENKIQIVDKLSVASKEIANIVYYYPLADGIGNFLKRPVVKISTNENYLEIIETGIRTFFDKYKDTVYPDGTVAKLGIYCGKDINHLEEEVYPLVERLVSELGMNPNEVVLRFHGGNKNHPISVDSKLEFESLDKHISKIRIVLLVQIGKEGWDCRSLTGIILSQEGDCPTNMVLQTSCRCLRQVQKNVPETALIYLNGSNAEKLDTQLKQQYHISIKEFENGGGTGTVTLKRYSRMDRLKLPKVNFYQLKINYETLILDESLNTIDDIEDAVNDSTQHISLNKEYDMKTRTEIVKDVDHYEYGTIVANFNIWIYNIKKESFGSISMKELLRYTELLKKIFAIITYVKDDVCYFSSKYHIDKVNANIRKAFYEKRTFKSIEELIPQEASLLKVDNFTSEVTTSKKDDYYPNQQMVENIILDDRGKLKPDKATQAMIEKLEQMGDMEDAVAKLKGKTSSYQMKDNTFHYLPYHTDSNFEQTFLKDILILPCIKNKGLEVYYNGDRGMTEFKIKCYKHDKGKWVYVGIYTPDFLIINRKDGKIHKAIIVETKGGIYANDPTFKYKRSFTENEFKKQNNEMFGYSRFEYLYLEDTMSEQERIVATERAIEKFFVEANH